MKINFEISVDEMREMVKWFEEEEAKERNISNSGKIDRRSLSNYARIFDDGLPGWSKDSEYNLMYLKNQEQYANDKLKAEGHLFLNDVYEMLGLPKSKAGQTVGWIYDEDNPIGDNFVSFGIFKIPNNHDAINGYACDFILDFNVDGEILNKI